MDISGLRREYTLGALDRESLAPDPIAQFEQWFKEALCQRPGAWLRRIGVALYKLWDAILGKPPIDVNAMVLATCDAQGNPSARTVLLKEVSARGFVFYTNYESRKGQDIEQNPRGCLVFYWPELERQVCVTGTIFKLPVEESAAYFATRPRGSQIAAWASPQSRPISSRKELESRWSQFEEQFRGKRVPLPPHWGGYVLVPEMIEFWQGRPNRLHDRFRYVKRPDGAWEILQIAP